MSYNEESPNRNGAVECIALESTRSAQFCALNPTMETSLGSTSINQNGQAVNLAEIGSNIEKSKELEVEIEANGVSVDNCKEKKVRQRLWTTILSTIVACIPFLLIGCTLGFPSGALLDLTDLEPREEFKLTREQADLFGALGYIGAVFGGPIAGIISDRIGRKPALMLVSLPYLTGYMMITYARFATDPVVFKIVLLVGRFITGIGLGWATLAVVVYVVEIAPNKQRGMVGSMIQLFLVMGILSVYTLSSFQTIKYFDTSLVLIGFVAMFTISMPFFCETPRWLLAHGEKKRAIAALKFLRGPNFNFKEELETVEANVKQSKQLGPKDLLKEFCKCNVLVPQLLVVVLAIFRVCGGLEAVNAFSATILRDSGVEQFREVSVYGTACARLITNLTVVFIADLVGRKILLSASGFIAFVGTLMLGVQFYVSNSSNCMLDIVGTNLTIANETILQDDLCTGQYAPFAIVSLVVYNIGFSLGWGPILWVVVGEILPLSIRGVGTGIAAFVTWGTASIIVGSYLSLVAVIQPWGVWWLFCAMNFLSVVFVIIFIFETKGKSLETIQQRYESKFGNKNLLNCSHSKSTEP